MTPLAQNGDPRSVRAIARASASSIVHAQHRALTSVQSASAAQVVNVAGAIAGKRRPAGGGGGGEVDPMDGADADAGGDAFAPIDDAAADAADDGAAGVVVAAASGGAATSGARGGGSFAHDTTITEARSAPFTAAAYTR